MTISSLLGCGLCTSVLSEALRYLLPGEGTAPATVSGAETTSQLQKVVLDPISGHDLSRHADPVSAVYCKSDCYVGRESPQDYRGVSFIPRPPSCSLASSSGPPFVPYSSGKGWDVMDTIFRIRLRSWWDFRDEFLRISWDPLYQEDPLWWSWAIQQREGVDLSLPVPDLSFYSDESDVSWGVLVGETLVSEFWFPSQKGILHQPQGDDGSPGWLLRVQLSSQRREDRSLLRLYHDSRLPQAIGSHEVSYTRRWSRTFFASGQRS